MAMKKSKQSTAKRTSKKNSQHDAVKWFMLMGYNKENEDETGLLAFDNDSTKHAYKIVHDTQMALKFPSKNINNVNGFGTPEQWLEFFNSEPDLDGWKFHLVKTAKN